MDGQAALDEQVLENNPDQFVGGFMLNDLGVDMLNLKDLGLDVSSVRLTFTN